MGKLVCSMLSMLAAIVLGPACAVQVDEEDTAVEVLPLERNGILPAGERLYMGDKVVATNNAGVPQPNIYLIMQNDCNLVLYQNGHASWASNTRYVGSLSCQAVMGNDGNLVVYRSGVARWASGSNPRSGAYLELTYLGSGHQTLQIRDRSPRGRWCLYDDSANPCDQRWFNW
jgi:hypothetical protein